MQSHGSFVQFCRAETGDSIKFPLGLIRPDIAGTGYEASIFSAHSNRQCRVESRKAENGSGAKCQFVTFLRERRQREVIQERSCA